MPNISSRYVPPTGPLGADLLIIGEAPGEQEDKELQPFVGPTGEILTRLLEQAGYSRANARITNICNYRPANNDFSLLEDSDELSQGIKDVKEYIQKHPPKMILILGGKPLEYLLDKYGISNYRGTPLSYNGIRVIATLHPAVLFRDYHDYPIILSDICRCINHINKPFPTYHTSFLLKPTGLTLEEAIDEIRSAKKLAIDIESVKDSTHIICVGFATSASRAIVIHNPSYDGLDPTFQSAITRCLDTPAEKYLHNGNFDKIMLAQNGFIFDKITWDTMVATHVMEPELPYGLDFLVSTYTFLPCYWAGVASGEEKAWSKKSSKRESIYEYNAYDCIATYMITEMQQNEMSKDLRRVMDFKMECLPLAEEMSTTGFVVDYDRRAELREHVIQSITNSARLVNMLTGKIVNPRSPKFKEFVYGDLGLPVRKKRDGGITTDEDAMIASITYCKAERDKLRTPSLRLEWDKKIAILKSFMNITGMLKMLSSYIDISIPSDGRVKSMFRPAATETSRWAAGLFVDGSGFNAQTLPREKV